MYTGGGRIIAGRLRNDLRRTYEVSKKYGKVNPLIYIVSVCPACFYAAYNEDFLEMDQSHRETALAEKPNRIKYAKVIFGRDIDFAKPRTLITGAASYFLAMTGYNYQRKNVFPTLKRAMCALRASWLLEDIAAIYPDQHFAELIPFFLTKSKKYYGRAIDFMQNGKETYEKVKTFGPDTDTNFRYDGVLYMFARLTASMSYLITDPKEKIDDLIKAKRSAAKIFGMGKSSKSKPQDLLDFSKELHTEIGNYIEELAKKFNITVEE
ncbi:MAG: DUF2225 domain-containing protein [Spirochaetes bacterium]|nr:DUF2225 domain-containing protein [Spirochaetota bacterium]